MATWDLSQTKYHVLFCNGSSCNKLGAEEVTQAIRHEITKRNLDTLIHTTRTRCNGRCVDRCVAVVYPSGNWYKGLVSEDASAFVNSLVLNRDLTEKISHTYTGEVFSREEGISKGISKDPEKVKKVSK
ncbi:(2Fe-2S) ferredoxin domain-containing protein [Virgibacillus sp. C22-A2]|uniref:(2Fe-2S) ferredoxin domain-containing protein n=1 Tax=Virgibacillus tibetensis TaxID=3042313 RepID=A0ABU6KLE1_9BACI|nr:(2Fe-2S) ferredoxin domain-containing protein [Virgibacillus sp. C22-A2]